METVTATAAHAARTRDRVWLKSYPEGVRHDVAPDLFRSLGQLLETSFKSHADRPFSVCMDWMPYRDDLPKSDVGKILRSELGKPA